MQRCDLPTQLPQVSWCVPPSFTFFFLNKPLQREDGADGKTESPLARPCFSRRPPYLCRIFLHESFHMAAHPSLLLPRVPLHGQGRGSRAAGRRKSCIPLNDRLAPCTNIYPDFPRGRKVKFRLLVPSGCQKCVFALQTYFQVLLRLTPCFLTGRDFQDRCPLIKRARRKHTDICTRASMLGHLRRWNFSSTVFKPPLNLLRG